MPEPADPHFLLDWARDLSAAHPFLDFHVHPFDVFSGDTGYRADQQVEGLFAKCSTVYRPPTLESIAAPIGGRLLPNDGFVSQRALLLSSRLTYTHTGPRVFADQLNLVGIAGALLLPVARAPESAQEMLVAAESMFPEDQRLLLACPFPVGIAPERIAHFFRWSSETKRVRAIKIHPNLAGIDLLTETGRELMEATLETAGQLGLPVIVHGGCTPGLESADAREYGSLFRLSMLDWGLSTAPVILAHAGCYRLTEGEIAPLIPAIQKLFEEHPNLLADTSALDLPALKLLLSKIDPGRLIFGSDALYFPVWKAWVAFLQALHLVSPCPDDDLIRIASLNPARCLAGTGQPIWQTPAADKIYA